ncbi:hypothetical protein Acor_74570 [Acrocarpospora corrugata]|uniref:FAD/NAD(P)-binding domain-containing protein n=1 Tax=Acrocarpospora corrugata TaxID=35763 RepID=A0A5M3WAI8_9ACTN|nr:hypothetical protein Acor_74570 [Acrocarpospora corrugata]
MNPDGLQGKRVVVVGGGNSAVQVADELVGVARVSLATRKPIRFVNQEVLGRYLHFWFTVAGFDWWPVDRAGRAPTAPVLDGGRYRGSLRDG